jgi:PAS domain-containing protein
MVIDATMVSQPAVDGERHAMAALCEIEARFRAVWDAPSEALALFDAEGVVLAVNPAYCRLYGRSAEELVGQSYEARIWATSQPGQGSTFTIDLRLAIT